MWQVVGVALEGVAKAQSGELIGGLADMRRGTDLLREQDVLSFGGLLKIALAEAEARAGGIDRALAILDEAVATAERAGYRAFEAELHRVLGEMLLNLTLPTWRLPRRRFRPPSPSRGGKPRAASNCVRRSLWPSSINRPATLPTPTPSSRRRSKALRQRPKCPRSQRLRPSSRPWPQRTRSRPTRLSASSGYGYTSLTATP